MVTLCSTEEKLKRFPAASSMPSRMDRVPERAALSV
jgi:hypothetical protein